MTCEHIHGREDYMKPIIFWIALLMFFNSAMLVEAGVTCEPAKLHSSAIYCKAFDTFPPEIADCCEGVCQFCHTQAPADLCVDCHEERFAQRENHPVEIVYDPDGSNANLKSTPVGPYLDCTVENGQYCLLRCVTCHKLHPNESDGNQLDGLLRVKTADSELCLRCHDK